MLTSKNSAPELIGSTETKNPRGSLWHRWEPHIHAPGTILNNQFKGDDPWADFLRGIENSEPRIKALGITDYYILDSYERMVQEKNNGRLTEVHLLFPNIELRFSIETAKGRPINAHLLVSPHDPDHLSEIKRFMSRLTYKVGDETYSCHRDDLIKLGKKHDGSIKDDTVALKAGANQFKVNYQQLYEEYTGSAWAKENVLIAISGGSNDGTPGLKEDESFASLRKELERISHVIFSSNEKQRQFWLGRGVATKSELLERWGGCKPCLHGSDAHSNDNIGKPAEDRFSWIKGDITFESLRQCCIEPEMRVHIGPQAPIGSMPSYTIESVEIKNTNWLPNSLIALNPGLTTIIGARGSGKTALADLIAAAGLSPIPKSNERSFIRRAENLFQEEAISLSWIADDQSDIRIQDYLTNYDDDLHPRVQYLSQQFVDQLCSSEGVTDELMEAIERVIFEAHSAEKRLGTTSFTDLVDLKLENFLNLRETHEQEVDDYTSEINDWREKKSRIPTIQKSLDEKERVIARDKKDRDSLIGKGSEERVKIHQQVSAALDTLQVTLDAATRRLNSLEGLSDHIANSIASGIPNNFRTLQEKYLASDLSETQWESFRLGYKGNVSEILTSEITKAKELVEKIKGPIIEQPQSIEVRDGDNLSLDSYNLLLAKQKFLQDKIGLDKENRTKFNKLSEKITRDEASLQSEKRDLDLFQTADTKVKDLFNLRMSSYKKVFQTLLSQEEVLSDLYHPLMESLKSEEGALGKLTFQVQRVINIESWSKTGEDLLDLRKGTTFRGVGTLLRIVRQELLPAWEKGSADDVVTAMDSFLSKYRNAFDEHSLVDKTNRDAYRKWSNDLARWIFGTSHISIKYGIQYDGVNIQQLSSGTRGIVLLLLYLAIDKDDFRPLLIDQPEENLDPKSIFDELVPRFRSAKLRRQIIIVTHNANLVVNTDADQVIIASCGDHRPKRLPQITYVSGGLENENVRQQVCEILEGGEEAFKERAKRLRVNF